MKINKRTNTTQKRIIFGAAILVAVVALGTTAYFLFAKPALDSTRNDAAVNYDKPTNDQKDAGDKTKENSVSADDSSKANTSGSDQAAAPAPQDNGKGKVSAVLTSVNQTVATLQARYDIGAVTNNGTCTLTLTKGSITVTKTAPVQALAGSSTCRGFDVPTNELSAGTWQLALHFENDSLTADTVDTAVVK